MRRSDHPSRPSAITCSRFSALKTLAIPAAGAKPTAHVNVSAPGAALAGFQVSINGRFWVSTEGWLPALRARRFDAAAGGRRWQGVQTFGQVNAEIGAAAGPVRRRASYYARNNPWIGNGVSAIVAGAVGCGIKPQSHHPDAAVRAALHER